MKHDTNTHTHTYTHTDTAFIAMMKIKTNILLILQAFPGTIPWGVLFAYLNDFLSQEKGLPVEQATLLVSLFGIGSAVGGIGGGLVGQYTYKRSKRLLPIVMVSVCVCVCVCV